MPAVLLDLSSTFSPPKHIQSKHFQQDINGIISGISSLFDSQRVTTVAQP
ncbi:MAG: hypothetical protein ACEY3J_04205 [Arsenophonus sp.]